MAKPYPINQSPLFKILGKRTLENLLLITIDDLGKLLIPSSYRVWTNEKNREIQQPVKRLALVHKRIGNLLSRIEVPDYVYSRKGRSYADNAKQHIGNVPLVKTDISKFYPSTDRNMVCQMFRDEFKCAVDISNILADVCCYQQCHLPTGSTLSGRIAFFAARPMFDEIFGKAQENGTRMTLYVDDITVSGSGATKKLVSEIREVVRHHGLKTKASKTKTFAAHAPKIVTGVVIVGDEIKLPNSRHKKIWETKRAIRDTPIQERVSLKHSLAGRLQEANQIAKKNLVQQQTFIVNSFVRRVECRHSDRQIPTSH